MEKDTPREASPSPARSSNSNTQPSPNIHHSTASEPGLDPALLNSSFQAAQFTQAGTNSTFHYGPLYPDSSAQPGGLAQTTNTETLMLQNNQLELGTFQNDQQLSFQNHPMFTGRILGSNNNYLFSNEHSNMPEHFSDTNFPLDSVYEAPQQPNVNPANLSKVPSSHASTPPTLLSPDGHHSPAQPGSPASSQGHFYTPQHSRHQSLDPASAAYSQGSAHAEWQGSTFQQHTRELSDHSDISSNSASPFLNHTEVQDSSENHPSPMMGAQQDGMNAFGIENFSINDRQSSQLSPVHSPYISPQLLPQQKVSLGMGSDFMLQQGFQNHTSFPGPEIYAIPPEVDRGDGRRMHARNTSVISDMGRADQFPAPTINIEPAPISRQASFEGEGNTFSDNLSPPARARGRSKSDPHVGRPTSRQMSRSNSPSHRPHSPSFGSTPDDRPSRSLSPGLGPLSRDSSPGFTSGRIEKSRRQSTSSISTREYFLGLADPQRANDAPPNSSTRGQRHPANFQCELCPKRFTRAYNLRSHTRTHTDERPFVCTVCGKAFARQHDRKRHEGLHSGEKRFVCKGGLGSGLTWGCGRKFARADALGRHFRSEAGRVCIKPLLDEEALDRARQSLFEQQQQQQAHAIPGALQTVQPAMMINMDTSGGSSFTLPAALLAQYPALNKIDWGALPQGDDGGDLSDVGMGTNSYEGSGSRADIPYDDNDMNEDYVNQNGLNYATGNQGAW